ncbi:putative extensin domain-containing protein [Tanacetum coccineum]
MLTPIYKSPPPPLPSHYVYKSPPPPPYVYKSPPPPSPYVYKSPPPPPYVYKSPPPPSQYIYKSPPPPPYVYKSPPPPSPSPPPPYVYKSPPPPSPSPPPPYLTKLVWVKLHGVPVTAFSEDGLSAIATKLGTPLMLDSYTSEECPKIIGAGETRNLKKPSQTPKDVPVGQKVRFKPAKQVFQLFLKSLLRALAELRRKI